MVQDTIFVRGMNKVKLLLLSGFNPFGFEDWYLDRYYGNSCCPKKRNWTTRDVGYIRDYYTDQFGDEEYIISSHSDGGTPSYKLAFSDERCRGLHCHAASFTKEKPRDIPLLITSNIGDLTGMHRKSNKAAEYYKSAFIGMSNQPRQAAFCKDTFIGHEYYTCISLFIQWCKQHFDWAPELAPQ